MATSTKKHVHIVVKPIPILMVMTIIPSEDIVAIDTIVTATTLPEAEDPHHHPVTNETTVIADIALPGTIDAEEADTEKNMTTRGSF